jgi:23S rRNA (cytidine1920-2'-O)/16S rRNA (cytidine1409-2'-O)-methyltransferase
VLVDDMPVDKPGAQVKTGSQVRLRGEPKRFVSRGGEKLAGALADLAVNPAGMRCLDVGASTGGFTDCLLAAGARQVVAVDVGYGQLAPRLREDPRVVVLERRNARGLEPSDLAGPVELITVDVSFISVRLLLPVLARVAPEASWLVLVKPQFEVGKGRVGKGGVVRDDALRAQAVACVREAAQALGLEVLGEAESRLSGAKGNREVFLHLRASPARA